MDRLTRLVPRGVTLSGLVVAGVGFFLTRFTVTVAMYGGRMGFLIAEVLPLVAGLAVSVFGVALTLGTFDPDYVRTVAAWCLIGTASMAVLLALTLYGTDPALLTAPVALRSQTHLSNFLIGGYVGGTLTGVYAARNRRDRREQELQAKRMAVLNRVLRDEVLNSVTAIQGYLSLLSDGDDAARERAVEVIDVQSAGLERRVDEVSHLTRSSRAAAEGLEPIDVTACLGACVQTARERYPGAEIVFGREADAQTAWANELLEHAVERLVENAIEHSDADVPRVELGVSRRGDRVVLTVVDNGPGLPADQRRLLRSGSVEEYDDPTAGFGLNVVSLLVESYRGRVTASVDESGTTVEIELADADEQTATGVTDVRVAGVSKPRLALAGAVSLAAGVLMGGLIQMTTGDVPVIGTLYGATDPVVGWVTHEFHSVVFGVVYVGLVGLTPRWYRETLGGRVTVGLAWGALLWLVAAGVVMPIWLRVAAGVPAALPNLTLPSLLAHLLWGGCLGALYSLALRGLPTAFPGVRLPRF